MGARISVRARLDGHDGWTLYEVMAVIFILGVLIAIAVASEAVATSNSTVVSCRYNLRTVSSAVELYNNDYASMPATITVLAPYVRGKGSLSCPTGARSRSRR